MWPFAGQNLTIPEITKHNAVYLFNEILTHPSLLVDKNIKTQWHFDEVKFYFPLASI